MSGPRILVTGGAGQLAEAIRKAWSDFDLVIPSESELDLCSPERILATVKRTRPQVVLNCGAFTQVDFCETEPDFAMAVNGEAVRWIAKACATNGARLIQISTDYVFDGQGSAPYRESDPPGPRTVYGKTKLAGERAAAILPDHLIARTAWLYDAWGNNFLRTMVKAASEGRPLKVVDDQHGTPTSCRALARQLRVAIEEGWRGTVHMTCRGETTWYGFARRIFEKAGIQADLAPCTTADFPRPAPRPAYSVLDGEGRGLRGTDVMPPWQDALDEVIATMDPGGSKG